MPSIVSKKTKTVSVCALARNRSSPLVRSNAY